MITLKVWYNIHLWIQPCQVLEVPPLECSPRSRIDHDLFRLDLVKRAHLVPVRSTRGIPEFGDVLEVSGSEGDGFAVDNQVQEVLGEFRGGFLS